MSRSSFTLPLLLTAFALSAFSRAESATYEKLKPTDDSSIQGSDPVTLYEKKGRLGWTAYVHAGYVIEVEADIESAGENIRVHYRPEGRELVFPDDLDEIQDWVTFTLLNDHNNNWFYGVYGKYMFIDCGCCKGSRGLQVYDLSNRILVHNGNHCQAVRLVKGGLSFWRETGEEVTLENCPKVEEYKKAGWGGAAIEEKVFLDLRTMKLRKTGEKRCGIRE